MIVREQNCFFFLLLHEKKNQSTIVQSVAGVRNKYSDYLGAWMMLVSCKNVTRLYVVDGFNHNC